MSALFGQGLASAQCQCVPQLSSATWPPSSVLRLRSSHPAFAPPPSMNNVHDPSRGDYPPLPKRPRISNPPPPSAFIPSPPGPSTAPIPDQDGAADAASKKNRKRPLSCGECRRLKLKCDRVFPCQSCCKRGCAEICPDGALTGGKGSRFILANTEQLHEKIKSMSGRIRELEDALHEARPGHPLLRDDLLSIKKSTELFGVDSASNHSPAAEGSRRSDFHHSLPSSSSPLRDDRQSLSPAYYNGNHDDLGIPRDILQVSDKFPAPSAITFELNPDLRQRIVEMLPPQAEARYLLEQAAEHAAWHENSDGSDGVPNMVHSVYNCSVSTLHPHRLSYFLIILALGVCVDQRRSHQSWVRDAERYHSLARAALCENSVIDEPSVDAINSLFYMTRYLVLFSVEKKDAVEYGWAILGIASKLAVGIGLHRNSSRSKVIPEELDKRKTLLWYMLVVDHRLGLMLRRPPSIAMRYVDVEPPSGGEYAAAGLKYSYQRWHYTFTTQCLSPILELVVSPNSPPYTDVLHLDARVRDYEPPPLAAPGPASGNGLCLMQAWTNMTRDIAILNLHRQYFTQALGEGLWANHRYACSVVAVYQASLNVLWSLETYYRQQPEYSVRLQVLWFNGLSAAMALSLLLCRAPPSVMTSNALLELAKLLRLFTDVSDRCPTASKGLPILERLFERSRAHYLQGRYGMHQECDPDDEVCKIATRTGIFAQPSASNTDPDIAPFPSQGAHPSLVRAFEEAIATTPPPNDPILMPGPLHLVVPASASANGLGANGGPGMSVGAGVGVGAGVERNGASSTGFGVSAERSGCQTDSFGPNAGPGNAQSAFTLGQNLKWLSQEYSESGWMTWF
ncbi:hypothetical protein PYCCODRAFT_1463504 [Trametes coccinea BRFM310]|uniref:Zn(2)-C6 fungal-type domain-containing protein n=1 Tax=Trametes coccinea (strain BRFM310) TaxID=1353009 RepID=A0A1Y2J1D6_TRAC3|nr:hypothetical protein PYCCODRAFT_1463504 [Trametes coccinea BRFM310]